MKPGKRRQGAPPFVALSKELLRSEDWKKGLTSSEKIVYLFLKCNYDGSNNGQIHLHYSELKTAMASATISSAFKGLEAKGWIEKTKMGGLFRYYNLYKLTGKHDKLFINFND